jgi:hypothetical protein
MNTLPTDAEIDSNRDLIAADLLAALKNSREALVMGIAFIGRDQGTPRIETTLGGLVRIFVEADAMATMAIQNLEGQGIRAQSFTERERDLLEASNRHLETARQATAFALETRRISSAALDHVGKLLVALNDQRNMLTMILPYAESRAEDMVDEAEQHGEIAAKSPKAKTSARLAKESREAADKAVDAVDAAKRMLGII